MCGIIGYLGPQEAMPILLDGLKRLEYRGYDSAGMAVIGQNGMAIRRSLGKLRELERLVSQDPLPGQVGIGHTRWATHGRPSETNAHPHQVGEIAVVHNGIIENYLDLKTDLVKDGHRFASETDTEIVSHLIIRHMRRGTDYLEAVRLALKEIKGSYALVIVNAREPRLLVAARKESPLILGLNDGEFFLASDIPAILPYTRRVIFLEDHDLVVVKDGEFLLLDGDGNRLERPEHLITWSPAMAEKAGYKHFMQKEIFEQPRALIDTFRSRINLEKGEVILEEAPFSPQDIESIQKIFLVACGTSYHAAMVGKHLIESLCRLPVEVHNASEYRYSPELRNEPPRLAIALTQSGETADTLAAMREAKRRGHATLAITNIIGSTAARDADGALQVHAGPEIGVAATKSYHAQLAVLYLVGLHLAEANNTLSRSEIQEHARRLERVPRLLQQTLNRAPQIEKAGALLEEATSAFYLGRQQLHPVAMEGALKLKEISYIHAEGYSGGELKHGPFALLTEKTPVVGLLSDDHVHAKMLSNLIETKARGAPLLVLTTDGDDDAKKYADATIHLPRSDPLFSPFPTASPCNYWRTRSQREEASTSTSPATWPRASPWSRLPGEEPEGRKALPPPQAPSPQNPKYGSTGIPPGSGSHG
jgi:glutamine---fructose-6-phosphate transaminase (isomerizing)